MEGTGYNGQCSLFGQLFNILCGILDHHPVLFMDFVDATIRKCSSLQLNPTLTDLTRSPTCRAPFLLPKQQGRKNGWSQTNYRGGHVAGEPEIPICIAFVLRSSLFSYIN